MKKSRLSVLLSALLLLGLCLVPSTAHAINMGEALASILGGLVGIVVWIGGNILIGIIFLVVWVAQYNDFITSPAVTTGWVIIRDICNMFFIVILLIIAFATVLNIEKYSWKHLLPKLLIMAVLINFSKLICGVLIDFAQVVMLTFVNGFRDIAAGNFAEMAGIHDLLNVPSNNESVSLLSVAGTYILALFYIIFSIIIMGVVLCVLVIRMIMLWILVVLSPFAYLLETTPSTKAYAGKWWSYFSSNLVSGPLLAFFIWLSFAATQSTSSGALQGFENNRPDGGAEEGRVAQLAQQSAGLASAGTPEGMLKFVISMGLLIGGLMMTKEIGGAAGAIAGKGLGAMSGTAKKLTGFNAVNDRVAAFNKKRDAARTEKIGAFADRAFGRYDVAKSSVKAGFSSMKEGVGTMIGSPLQKTKAGVKNIVDKVLGSTAEERTKKREERREHTEKRREAYINGYYEKDGVKYYEASDRQTGRTHYVDINGNRAQDSAGNDIEKMSKTRFNAGNAWTQSMYGAKGNKDKKQKEESEKESDKMANAGLSPVQLLAILEDASASQTKRLAAAMTLGLKQGFKTNNQVKLAEKLIKSTGNNALKKKFNDDVDKKQAYMHYDLSTQKGRDTYIKRRDEGKIELQQAESLENPDFIKTHKEGLSSKEFIKETDKWKAAGSKYEKAFEIGMPKYMDTLEQPVLNAHGEVDKARKVAAVVTHDMKDAARGAKTGPNAMRPIDVNLAVKGSFEKMTNKEISELGIESWNTDGDAFDTDLKKQAYKEAYEEMVANLKESDMKAIERMPGANRQHVRKMREVWDYYNPPAGGAPVIPARVVAGPTPPGIGVTI